MTLLADDGFYWNVQTKQGTVSISAVAMQGPAWHLPDLSGLFRTPDVRYVNQRVPGVDGETTYEPDLDPTRFSLPLLINGYWDRNGIEYANPWAGLETNLAYLQMNVFLPPSGGDGTRPFVWTTAAGTVISVDIEVLPLAPPILVASGAAAYAATLEISSPNADLHL
jgi:hypothetical protein